MSEKQIKVTDRRMFTADGELRDEYSHLDAATQDDTKTAEPAPAVEEQISASPDKGATAPAEKYEPLGANAPGFLELIALLAEPASIYLRQSRVPDGQSAQNLELARLHIDLLGLLKEKTAGNLDPQERAVLEDALYQLRMQFVEFGG